LTLRGIFYPTGSPYWETLLEKRRNMSKYIFLDAWVYSRLGNTVFEQKLSAFLKKSRSVVLVTSLGLTELYNPDWDKAGPKDRMYLTAQFLGKTPCVIVDPLQVFKAELPTYPDSLKRLPVELDLDKIPAEQREEALVKFLRRGPVFLAQGKDIEQWRENYDALKASWLEDVEKIIADGINNGYLELDAKGNIVPHEERNLLFLMSLDLRHAAGWDTDKLVQQYTRRARDFIRISAIRLTSLYFWYAYVNVDNANKMKRNGSDIGDFYHMSLIPYCSAFTVDNTMFRLLERVSELSGRCKILNTQRLDALL
jgi:hypothetical protein